MLAALQLLQRFRPVLAEEPRHRPIGQEPPAGLTPRAVVRLVLGVDDALDGGAADGAGLAETAVDGHAFSPRGYLLRELACRFGRQAVAPADQGVAHRRMESRDLGVVEVARELGGGEARGVEDLVG